MKKRLVVGMLVMMMAVTSVASIDSGVAFAKEGKAYTEMTSKELKKEKKNLAFDIKCKEMDLDEANETLDKLENKKQSKRVKAKIKETKEEIKELTTVVADLKEEKKEVSQAYKKAKELESYKACNMEDKGAYVIFTYNDTTFAQRQIMYDVRDYFLNHPDEPCKDFWGMCKVDGGDDVKYISFTVSNEVAEQLKDENNVYGAEFTMCEHMDDLEELWILPSVQ